MVSLIKSIAREEWVFVSLMIVVIVAVTAVPYLYGYLNAPPQAVYTGIHHLTPGDANVFLSMIEQVKQGDNVFINLYTSEPQHRLLVNPLWLSVGWLGKALNLSNLLTFHVARSLWIIIFISVVYLFIAYFFREPRKRKWILLLVLFSSGLGVFFNPFLFDVNNIYEHPTDIWVSESITFLSLYHSPHLIASLTLIVLIFLLGLLAFERNQLRYSVSAGVACSFLLWFHPFNGPTVYLVLAVYLVVLFIRQRKINWSHARHYLLFAVIPLPVVAYLFTVSRVDWVTRQWSAQNILPSPSVWMYLIGYGVILLLALVGLWISLKKPENKRVFLTVWVISSAFLLYAPLTFQRRMSEGLHIPLTILAALGMYFILGKLAQRDGSLKVRQYAFIMLLVIFLPLTNVQILGQDIYMYQTKKTLPYYLYEGEVEAMRWLKRNVPKDEVIFSSYYMGNYIPAYSGRIVWIGHGPQTIDLPDKKATNDWFWRDDAESQAKRAFLQRENITYVFYGRKEKEIGTYSPATKDYLKKVFSDSQAEIYRVL